MHVTILTLGTRGDVQPFVALGVGLKHAGYAVSLATHRDFEKLVKGHGLEFRPVSGDVQALMESGGGRSMLEKGRNPLSMARSVMRAARPMIRQLYRDCWDASQGADVLLLGGYGIIAGPPIAEKMGIPYIKGQLQPLTPTRAFPSALMPPSRLRLGGRLNYLTHIIGWQAFWQTFRPAVNRARKEVIDLPPLPFWGPASDRRRPVLYGFSPHVVPRPHDWGNHIHVTGYWFLDRPTRWHPPAEIKKFLRSGPPPVYVGFGSMSNSDPEETAELVLKALALSRRRGVLLAGWSGLRKSDLPKDVFMTDTVPHDWLFPRMAAIVHHGGAGTTAESLRAGVPTIIVPFFSDQPFWGHRVARLGVGPPPIPRKKLTAARLAHAITAAVTNKALRRRAAELGAKIRAEEGVARAVEAFHRQIGKPVR